MLEFAALLQQAPAAALAAAGGDARSAAAAAGRGVVSAQQLEAFDALASYLQVVRVIAMLFGL